MRILSNVRTNMGSLRGKTVDFFIIFLVFPPPSLALPKVLMFENPQINLEFYSLNRTFVHGI